MLVKEKNTEHCVDGDWNLIYRIRCQYRRLSQKGHSEVSVTTLNMTPMTCNKIYYNDHRTATAIIMAAMTGSNLLSQCRPIAALLLELIVWLMYRGHSGRLFSLPVHWKAARSKAFAEKSILFWYVKYAPTLTSKKRKKHRLYWNEAMTSLFFDNRYFLLHVYSLRPRGLHLSRTV